MSYQPSSESYRETVKGLLDLIYTLNLADSDSSETRSWTTPRMVQQYRKNSAYHHIAEALDIIAPGAAGEWASTGEVNLDKLIPPSRQNASQKGKKSAPKRKAKAAPKLYSIRILPRSGAWAGVEYDLPLAEAKRKANARKKQGYYAAVFQGRKKVWEAK